MPLTSLSNLDQAWLGLCQKWCEREEENCFGVFFEEVDATGVAGCNLCLDGETAFPHWGSVLYRKPIKIWPQWKLVYQVINGAVIYDLGEESINKLFQESRYHVLRYDKDDEFWGVYRRYSNLSNFQVVTKIFQFSLSS